LLEQHEDTNAPTDTQPYEQINSNCMSNNWQYNQFKKLFGFFITDISWH